MGSQAIVCNIGEVGAGNSVVVSSVAQALTAGTFSNTVAVYGAEADPNTANNTATVTVTVNPSTKPLINGFWPANGVTNTAVILFGNNFLVTPGVNPIVKFNNGTLPAPIVQVLTPDMLFVMQPAGTTVGKITLETAHGVASSPTDYNVIQPGLKINGLWPGEVKVGGFDFIFGAGFSLIPGANKVDINGVPAPIVQALDTTLLGYIVPDGAASGPVHVTTGGVSAASPVNLVVLP